VGDLLSSQGRVVKAQEELLARFHPPPIPTDFGLDALFIVSDATAWPAPPRCVALRVRAEGPDLTLHFDVPGRVFQLETATAIVGPWLPIRPLGLDLEFTDAGALTKTPQAFYRLRQW